MDGQRFDRLVKSVVTRRSALGLLAGLAGLGVEEATARRRRRARPGSSGKPLKCVPNSACAKWCAETFGADTPEAGQCTSDANKCKGACWTCGAGCGSGCDKRLCNDACVELGTIANCGGCGDACADGKACRNGTCACPAGATDCGGTCVDTGSAVDNCGSCGTVCPGGECTAPTCTSGECGTAPARQGLSCDGGAGTCDSAGACQPNAPHVCSGKYSPDVCFERSAATCGGIGTTCRCGTDIHGALNCYENGYANAPWQEQCASNADCERMLGRAGAACHPGGLCGYTFCTTPCPAPTA